MDATMFKELGLSGEAIFVLLCLMFLLQITKLIMDYVSKVKGEGGATHDDILKLCYTILEKLEHK
jgi:hypothetical protein